MTDRVVSLLVALVMLAAALAADAKAQYVAGAALIWVAAGMTVWIWADLRKTERARR